MTEEKNKPSIRIILTSKEKEQFKRECDAVGMSESDYGKLKLIIGDASLFQGKEELSTEERIEMIVSNISGIKFWMMTFKNKLIHPDKFAFLLKQEKIIKREVLKT